jgi:hypothetical protein
VYLLELLSTAADDTACTTETGTTIQTERLQPMTQTQSDVTTTPATSLTTTTLHIPSKQTTSLTTTTLDIPSTQTTSLTTTTLDIPSTQTTFQRRTIEKQTFNSSYCTCACKESNTTVSERMAIRKRDLELNVRNLSAFTRKLTSAPNQRLSSARIGYVGIVAIIFAGLFVVLYDIWSFVIA